MKKQILFAACFVCAAFFTAAAQGDLCSDIKSIVAQYHKDKSKLLGAETGKEDMMTDYKCPLPLSGAASVETSMYTSTKKIAHSIGYYAKDADESASKKQFDALVEKFRHCYPDARTESDDASRQEYAAAEGKSQVYLARFRSGVNPDTDADLYSIHIQIMFYD